MHSKHFNKILLKIPIIQKSLEKVIFIVFEYRSKTVTFIDTIFDL